MAAASEKRTKKLPMPLLVEVNQEHAGFIVAAMVKVVHHAAVPYMEQLVTIAKIIVSERG